MARLFGMIFGGAGALSRARAAELRGDLARATALFALAGRADEAARVLLVRGDCESKPAIRLRHYARAVATAPDRSGVRAIARQKRAIAVVAMAKSAPLDARLRRDLLEAARELEELGDNEHAADAYARAGEIEAQARALAQAGDIEKLDALLDSEQRREREVMAGRLARDGVDALIATGSRREAAQIARVSTERTLRERGAAVETRRLAGPIVSALLHGRPIAIVLGDEVVIGRTSDAGSARVATGSILVASASVSRRHLCLLRRGEDVVIRDLASRNGTTLRGLALDGDARVGDGIEVTLGSDVRLLVQPTEEIPRGVAVHVAGARYVAPLGPALLGIGRWRLERAEDGWIELATEDAPPAFAGSLRLSARIELVEGDVLACKRGGKAVLEMRTHGG